MPEIVQWKPFYPQGLEKGRGGTTHIVQPSSWISIRDNLDSSVHPLCCHTFRHQHVSQAELANTLFVDSWQESDIEVYAGVVAHTQEHLHFGFIVLHGKLNGTTSQRPLRAICRRCILPAAWEMSHLVFIGVAGGWGVESEVGKSSEREKREEEKLRVHGGMYFGKEQSGYLVRFAVYCQQLDGGGWQFVVVCTERKDKSGDEETTKGLITKEPVALNECEYVSKVPYVSLHVYHKHSGNLLKYMCRLHVLATAQNVR